MRHFTTYATKGIVAACAALAATLAAGVVGLGAAPAGWSAWIPAWALAGVAGGLVGGLLGGGVAGVMGSKAQQVQSAQLDRHQTRIAELETENRLLQAFMDHAPVLMAIKDRQGRYVRVNQAFDHMYDVKSADIKGKLDQEMPVLEFATAQAVHARDMEVLASGASVTYQLPITSRGTRRHMEAYKFVLYDDQQQAVGLGLVAADVTERNIALEKYKRIIEVSPNLILITRLIDGVVIEANAGFERLSGHSREGILGQPLSSINIWYNPEHRQQVVERLIHHGQVVDFETEMRVKDGRIRNCVVNSARITLDDQADLYAVWIVRDVTEAHLAAAALRDSEARFISLFDNSPLPTSYSTDGDGHARNYRNQAFYTTFGYSPETDRHRTTEELNLWVTQQDKEIATQILQGGKPVDNWEVQVRCGDGQIRWVSLFGRFIVQPTRTILVTALFDITNQRLAQEKIEHLNATLEHRVAKRTEQLEAANAELQQTLSTLGHARDSLVQAEKLASLGALVAGVAHELNTPIGNGLTVASTLEERARDFAMTAQQPMQRATLQSFIQETLVGADILVRSLQRAATLVTSFKQVAVDQTSSQRRAFNLSHLVDEAVITISPATRRAGCQVLVEVAPDLLLDGYPGPLVQVLTNLINNALMHAFDHQAAPRIDLHALALVPDQVQIRVRDNGCGIAPEHLKHIYDPFFTTRLGQGGSGLGLHIVHNMVNNLLGGRIDVQTTVGVGTEFVLQLPRVAPQPSRAA